MTKFILISIFPFLHLPGVEKLFKFLLKKVVCHSPYDSRLPPVYSNLASWSHLGTKAASGAHLSTSHKIQQYLSPTSENICQYVGGKCLQRGMCLSWRNFLTWYKIFFSFCLALFLKMLLWILTKFSCKWNFSQTQKILSSCMKHGETKSSATDTTEEKFFASQHFCPFLLGSTDKSKSNMLVTDSICDKNILHFETNTFNNLRKIHKK